VKEIIPIELPRPRDENQPGSSPTGRRIRRRCKRIEKSLVEFEAARWPSCHPHPPEKSMKLKRPALCAPRYRLLCGFAAPQAQNQDVPDLTSRDAQQARCPWSRAPGFLQEGGAEVGVKFVSSGSEIPSGMAGGSIPIAIASWTNPMAMVANGVPARILAGTTDVSGAQQMVVKKDGPIKTPKDLEGRKLR
jgi:hypothetical protein